MDAHTIEVGAGALAIAVGSGFGGAYLGARMTTSHDRIERARTRRIEAADDLVQAWGAALFAIDAAINEAATPARGQLPSRIAEARNLINSAVNLSTRLDLLLGAISLASRNEDAIRDHARASVAAAEKRDVVEARKRHGAASVSLAWLVNTAAEAIASTGTRHDPAKRFKEVRRESEADPTQRSM